ncbi:serine hydrolase domain-containing protein [Butyrivibrio proteoclasticus]|uniref:serine hydrolase domain-containing protein n=1 Tax=Butyrivibrio proteoclasticus TaxID=43305 RepID=UPI000478C7CC|nr:serine hydrolase domain-containing protein [Butyrivibrio proteoclasticus]
MFTIKTALPEEKGIPSGAIRNMLEYWNKKDVPMHSLLIMRGDELVFEKYYAPYKAATLHRMFSITKSLVGIGIALLTDEGKVSMDASICDYFPEYVTADTHPWIKATTIRNMLEMRTCHAACTYKVDMTSDWVESFFTVAPTHKPGTIFHYDTSAAHVLCALIEKVSEMEFLDFMKNRLLKHVDFSEDSYMVKDPFGVSMGGSGLMATPMDVLKVLYVLSKKGTICCSDGQVRTLINPEYIGAATSNISDTIMTSPLPSEGQGYGMQIWQNEKGGYVLFGMGGQLAISIPSYDLLVMTTADTQGMAGGNQIIYDGIYDVLLPGIEEDEHSSKSLNTINSVDKVSNDFNNNSNTNLKLDYKNLMEYADALVIAPPRVPESYLLKRSVSSAKSGCYSYSLSENQHGYKKLMVSLSNDGASSIVLSTESEDRQIVFGIDSMQEGVFKKYNTAYTAGATWLRDNVLFIKVHLIGESVGSIRIELYFGDDDIVLYMRKIEETYFKEFDGHFYGHVG